jgi:hypothetical protein
LTIVTEADDKVAAAKAVNESGPHFFGMEVSPQKGGGLQTIPLPVAAAMSLNFLKTDAAPVPVPAKPVNYFSPSHYHHPFVASPVASNSATTIAAPAAAANATAVATVASAVGASQPHEKDVTGLATMTAAGAGKGPSNASGVFVDHTRVMTTVGPAAAHAPLATFF